jgi:serine/threonine protein kinase
LQVKLKPPNTPAAAAAADGSSADYGAGAADKQQQQQQDPPSAGSQPAGGSSSSSSSDSSNTVPIPWSCSDEALLQLIATRDPQGIGLEGGLALRLLQRLLAWDPAQRPTAAQAQQHAYFTVARQLRGEPKEEPTRGDEKGQNDRGDADAKFRAGKLVKEQSKNVEKRGRRQQRMDAQPEAAAALQGQVERVRALLQQQAAALQGCSSIPVGVSGWC